MPALNSLSKDALIELLVRAYRDCETLEKRADGLQHELDRIRRKAAHGCSDARCELCDK